MVIYMEHPKHGRKVACSEAEAKFDETKGWKRYELAALLKSPVNALVSVVDVSPDAKECSLDDLRKEYEGKFGKKPHHKKSADTLRAELAA